MDAAVSTLTLATLPALRDAFAGGKFVGITTKQDGQHCAVILLDDKPASELTWSAASEWASGIGGELPSRPVAALLFANARAEFKREWYWTSESHEADGAYAWHQYFGYGSQLNFPKSCEGRCRAVRLIQISS